MSFKDIIQQDIKRVFLNDGEFAEEHNIIYDNQTFPQIPILLTKIKQSESTTNNAEGLYIVSAVAHIALSDMRGIVPEQDQYIRIDDGTALGHPFYREYKIITSSCDAGMIVLELQVYGE